MRPGIAEGAEAAGLGRVRHPSGSRDADAALAALPPRLRDGDVVLVKASRGIALDTVVDGLRRELGGGRGPMTSEFAQVELIQGLLLAFALMVILMSPYIRVLHALGFGKRIREEGPESHYVKEGTPTMGGLLIVVVVIGIYFFLRAGPDASTFAPLAALAGVGAAGRLRRLPERPDRRGHPRPSEADLADRRRVRRRLADPADVRHRPDRRAVRRCRRSIDPRIYVAFATLAIVAAANGVNITDGLDGLSGGTLAIAFVAYMLIALLNVPLAQPNLALLCALIIGALLGFLWFNVHPAQIFIGDSGALALGATLAVTALITGQILVLPLIGIIFVIETLSVIIQVAYFKMTGGKRLFRMSPIHHHFELGGWDEEKITIRFWIVGILAALLGVTLFLASIHRL